MRTIRRSAPAALRALVVRSSLVATALAGWGGVARAQQGTAADPHAGHGAHGAAHGPAVADSGAAGRRRGPAGPDDVARPSEGVLAEAVDAAMASPSPGVDATPSERASARHLKLTPARAATAADRQRAAAVADTLRRALARYEDVLFAETDGYKAFLPNVRQPVYHFTSVGRALAERQEFDPARPASLLYRKEADGRYTLVGAMYTAPRDATPAELDARVPLSVARWHAHVDICLPRGGRGRWLEREGGVPRFGPGGAIATREACDAAGGRFVPQLFGWMLHANLPDASGGAVTWGEHGGHGH